MNFLTKNPFPHRYSKPLIGIIGYFSRSQANPKDDVLLVWRKRIFFTIFFSAIFFGSFTYIPNMKISVQSGMWLNAFIYTVIYLFGIFITLLPILPFKFRVWSGLFLFYALGLTSLVTAGPVGSGRMWLFAFAVLASLLLGIRAGVLALLINIGTLSSLTLLLKLGHIDLLSWLHISPDYWVIIGTTFMFMNTMITISLGVLVTGLETNLKKEQSLAKELKLSNQQLEKENAERKSAQESLRRSEERFRIVSQITSDFSYSFRVNSDSNLVLEWLTEAISRITEFDSTELSWADGWTRLIHPEDKSIKDRQLKTLLSGKSKTIEYRIKSKSGKVRWLLDHGYPLLGEDLKQVTQIYGAVQDITIRKAAIEALQESEEKYRLLIENADTAIFIAQDEKIKFPNPKTLEISGYSEDELKKIPLIDLIHPEDKKAVVGKHLKWLKGKKLPSTYSFRVVRKNGDEIWANLNTAFISWEGRPATLTFLRDITEQKELETKLQHAQKMEAIGTLAGGVAHDLNNILSGLVSYPEILLLDLPEDSPMREPIKILHDSGKKSAAIVQDLLTLARRGVTISEVVDLNTVISEYLISPEHNKILSYHPGVEVKTELDENLLHILGSSVHLSKTIMNLVSNAAEAMPDGGKIHISTTHQYIDNPKTCYETIEEGEYVVLSISDTGIGISMEEIGKIFEPFYTKKVMGRSGTGLGMAVVWGTIKDHNGYIDVQSKIGKGTTFNLYFPVTRKEMDLQEEPINIEDYMGHGESILVVDDVESQRDIATRMLSKIGYNANSVSSGEEAVEYLKEKPTDLLVLDMVMDPGINGLETYKRILQINPEQKAVVASGFSESEAVKEVQGIGAGAYLKKPYSLENIGMAVRAELMR